MIRSVLDSPGVYRLWQAPFVHKKFRPIRDHGIDGFESVLDIGCGPGTNARFFPNTRYVGLDLDAAYIAYASSRFPGTFLARDVNDGLADLGSFDLVLMNSLMHHLNDDEASRLLRAAAEAVAPGGVVHIVDLVLPETRSLARGLARLDRGKFARPYDEWVALIGRHLTIDLSRPYSVGLGPFRLWSLIHIVCHSPPAAAE
ncbi:MAG TPA: class I SAM-dependent methyltransferase [Acidimicrobiia bacterium]|nr:class I SAM-dependent methyltransferase [Acidimicrobiia bacterium]